MDMVSVRGPGVWPPTGEVPARVGSHRILRRIATGGTSDILLACTEGPGGFERVVVLKVLSQQLDADGRFETMFAREAAAYGRLAHPAVVRLYDFFREGERPVLVLEYVDGLPLSRVYALLRGVGGRIGDSAALFLAWRMFSALAACHSAKDPITGGFGPVIHRDINPSNVLVPWDGHVKIIDFGFAKVSGIEGDAPLGLLEGTSGYVSPEQARGEEVTVRTDIYAGCVLLWEMLAARKATRVRAEDYSPAGAPLPRLPALATLRPELPASLLDAVAYGLAEHPDARAVSAEDMCNVLRSVADLDAGRRELVATLSTLRSPAVQEIFAGMTPPPETASTPVTPSVAETRTPSHRPVSMSASARPQGIGALWLVGIAAALSICASALSRGRTNTTVHHADAPTAPAPETTPTPTPAPETTPTPTPAPAPETTPTPTPAPAVSPPDHDPTSGTITVPASRAGHRVWIDDRLVGESPGHYIVLCGTHTVRVGSQGVLRHIRVTCDADVVVQ